MNIKKFASTKFNDRIEAVAVPDLADFFKEGEIAEIKVRGLTAEELMTVGNAPEREKTLCALVDAMSAGGKDAASAAAEALGISGKKSDPDFIRKLTILTLGSVDPIFDRPAAVHLATNYATIFLALTTKILELTGMHRQPGKQKGSGKTNESEPA